MPTNIEIKAVLRGREFALKVAKELSRTEGEINIDFVKLAIFFFFFYLIGVVLKQEDTFYNVPNGRLKVYVI